MSKEKADLSKVRVEVKWYEDMWEHVKNATMTTIGKDKGKYPDDEWKRAMLVAEHSPIRISQFLIKVYNAPQFVHGHLVRHSNGVTPFISTLRSDRNDYEEIPSRNTLQDGEYLFNTQALINISRKRLCSCASYETRYVWNKILDEVEKYEPQIRKVCVKECVYRGFCPEIYSCHHHKTEEYKKEVGEYRQGINE